MTSIKIINQVFANDVVGIIEAPGGVPQEVTGTGNFLSGLVRFFIIIAGIFAFYNFLSGGLQYITSGGDKSKISEAGQKITNSIVGLIIITASFVITAILGQLLFGNPMAILAPELEVIK